MGVRKNFALRAGKVHTSRVPVRKKAKTKAKVVAAGGSKVGLRPKKGWAKRNFLTEVLIPSVFAKRQRNGNRAVFPKLKEGEICITWIGHASFLVQIAGYNILIDPNWAKWLKVIKRVREPGLQLHELPSIDLVLVTHAHFDHLDRRTLRKVAAEQPIVVPFEVGNLVTDLGFRSVHELQYWEHHHHGPLTITLTPCHHWGARILHDSHRGFGGFVIQAGGRSIYHCGDTAFFNGFKEIGARLPIEIALLPIGAYDPPSGRDVHMNPEEAVQAFLDLQAKILVPMHYGSFRLSYEPLEEPPSRLLVNALGHGIADRVCVMAEGEPTVF
jgi:L-ascorbate metabolism protein UlaG (beta-lactamase superfamily)